MLGFLVKYHIYLVGLILLVYTSSTFQKPLVEALHFIAHSFEYTSGEVKVHSFSSHFGDHQHEVLASLSEISQDEKPDNSAENNWVDTKKVFDHILPLSKIIFANRNIKASFPINYKSYLSGYKNLVHPPPQFFHFA